MSILSRVQSNPEIGTENEAFVNELVDRARQEIVLFCKLPRFPELSRGYSKSGFNPETDFTTYEEGELSVSVNGSGFATLQIDLSACSDGDAVALALQEAIHSDPDDGGAGFDEVSVTYNDDVSGEHFYLIQSGRFGEKSAVNITFPANKPLLARALSLSPLYGGTEVQGMAADKALETAAVILVEQMYRELGIEGIKSGSVPGGISFSRFDFEPRLRALLGARRRLWK